MDERQVRDKIKAMQAQMMFNDAPRSPTLEKVKIMESPPESERKIPFDSLFLTPEQEKVKRDFFSHFTMFNPYNPILKPEGKFFRKLKYRWQLRQNPFEVYQIRMELMNGKHRTFLVRGEKRGFFYNEGKYVFDTDMMYFDVDAGKKGLWTYDYHEAFPMPIKRQFPVNDIVKAIKAKAQKEEIRQVEYATNPERLMQFINSTIIEQILKGGELLEMLKKMMLMLFIVIAGVGIIGLLVWWSKGEITKEIVILRDGLSQFLASITK